MGSTLTLTTGLCGRSLYVHNPDLYQSLVANSGLNNEGVHESTTTNKASCAMAKHKTAQQAYESVIALFHSLQFSPEGSTANAVPDKTTGGVGLFGLHQEKVIEKTMAVLSEIAARIRSEPPPPIIGNGLKAWFNSSALSLDGKPVRWQRDGWGDHLYTCSSVHENRSSSMD
jgi:hypothetical protein